MRLYNRDVIDAMTHRLRSRNNPIVMAIAVYVVAAAVSGWLVWKQEDLTQRNRRAALQDLVTARANAVSEQLAQALSATYPLAALVQQGDGVFHDFDNVASKLLPYYPAVAELQLAPDGITRDVVPRTSIRTGIGRNLLKDPARSREALRARDSRRLTLAGPFNLAQGGVGVIGRLPVFINTADESERFWGFVSAVVHIERILAAAELDRFQSSNIHYRLWRHLPDSSGDHIIAASSLQEFVDPVETEIEIANTRWILSAVPVHGWNATPELIVFAALALVFSGGLGYLALLHLTLRAHRQNLSAKVIERTQEILSAQEKLKSTIAAIPDVLCEIDCNGTYFDYHAPAGSPLGMPGEDMAGKTIFDHLGSEASATIMSALQEAERNGRSQGFQFCTQRSQEIRWYELSVARKPAPPGESPHFILLAHDITQRKAQEQRAQRLLNENEIILRNAMVGIVHLRRRHIVSCNRRVEEILGFEQGELVGRSADLLFGDQDDFERSVSAPYKVLASGASYTTEMVMRRYDGGVFWGALTGSAINPAAPHDGSIWIVADITDRKRAKEELLRLNEELEDRVARRTEELLAAKDEAERANLSKSEFLSSMSHELRTPLNAILGFSQLMKADDSAPLTHDQAESIDEILRAGNHLLQLINEVLDLARIESGRLELVSEPVDLSTLLQECLSLMRPQAETRQIALSGRIPEQCLVRGDRLRLRQLILNLLSNAIKYNSDGGQVALTCEQRGPLAVIRVRDTGVGIPDSFRAQLFKPFERCVPGTQQVEGTGIGLALCKRLIEAMGGSIAVESVEGRGSVFEVTVPIDEQLPQELPAPFCALPVPPTPADAAARRHTLLYVEDNPANLRLVQKIVARNPALKLLDAPTAELGIELARNHPPDVILLDIGLPDMSGIDAFERMREMPELHHVPIVAVSANAMPADIAAARAAGFDEYLTKPIDVAHFEALISDILHGDSSWH